MAKSIFKPVVKQLNEFVLPNIMKKQEEQMDLSLCYHAVQIEIEIARSKKEVINSLKTFIIRCKKNLHNN